MVHQLLLKVIVGRKNLVRFDESIHVTAPIDHLKYLNLVDSNASACKQTVLDSTHVCNQTELHQSEWNESERKSSGYQNI